MKFQHWHPQRAGSAALILISASSLSFAQQVPDAGSLLREQPRAPATQPAPSRPLAPAASPEQTPGNGPSISIKGFRIQGATLIAESELLDQIKNAQGREVSLEQLQSLRTVLVRYYAGKGYLARVIMPEQEIKNGIVTFQIVEGMRGSLRIDGKGERFDPERLKAFVDQRLPDGKPVELAALNEALTILNEQPGIAVRAEIAPGQKEHDVDLIVKVTEQPLVRYGLQFNNSGSRGTGEYQVTGTASLANPSGRFDAASVLLNAAQGSTYLRADYSLAVGDRGLRLGANASALDYKITQGSLKPLDAHGDAATLGLTASYPLLRRNDASLSVNGSFDHKHLRDYSLGTETSNRRIQTANLGVQGLALDGLGGGGNTSYGASIALGDTDISRNASALAADAATRRTNGSFSKLSWNLGRAQTLSSRWTLFANVRGQFTADNLDSSERLTVGGPDGVRAYPTGEAAADAGWIAGMNLAYQLSPNATTSFFVDGARITLNHNTWDGWDAATPGQANRYSLLGAGVGVAWKLAKDTALNASLATPIGSNPGRDANGNDSDGSRRSTRGWVTLSSQF